MCKHIAGAKATKLFLVASMLLIKCKGIQYIYKMQEKKQHFWVISPFAMHELLITSRNCTYVGVRGPCRRK